LQEADLGLIQMVHGKTEVEAHSVIHSLSPIDAEKKCSKWQLFDQYQ
jgi:hypothetical protein